MELRDFITLVQEVKDYGIAVLVVCAIVAVIVMWRKQESLQKRLEKNYELRSEDQEKLGQTNKEVFGALINNTNVINQFREMEERRFSEIKTIYDQLHSAVEEVEQLVINNRANNESYFQEMRVYRENLRGKLDSIADKADALRRDLDEALRRRRGP